MSQKQQESFNTVIVDKYIYFDENYENFKKLIEENLEEFKSVTGFSSEDVFTVESEYSKAKFEGVLKELGYKNKFEGLSVNLQEEDIFLLCFINELKEAPISSKRYDEVKNHFAGKDAEFYQLMASFVSGYNTVCVITQEDIYVVTMDEYLYNITKHGFGGPIISIFVNHFLIPVRNIKGVLEKVCDLYRDDSYNEIIIKKKKDDDVVESKTEIVGDDTKFVTLKQKYPHSKIELNTYKGKVNKYNITERFKLKKMK